MEVDTYVVQTIALRHSATHEVISVLLTIHPRQQLPCMDFQVRLAWVTNGLVIRGHTEIMCGHVTFREFA